MSHASRITPIAVLLLYTGMIAVVSPRELEASADLPSPAQVIA